MSILIRLELPDVRGRQTRRQSDDRLICPPHGGAGIRFKIKLIIPAQNYQSRSAELDHIETWAARNNLHLNRAKCVELIISEPRRRRQFNLPPCISDITRVSSLKVLGVTITGKMSVSEHVRSVINSCAQNTRFAYFEAEGWMMPSYNSFTVP